MVDNQKIEEFVEKVKKLEKGEKLDLSSGEDLSIGIMNLISIEEHLFFSGGKTGKTKYYDLIDEIRRMRVELLKEIIKDYGGEEWCISKHLLAASMRVMEVGTKAQKKGEKEKAYGLFKKSFDLYNLFWAINLGMIKKEDLKKSDEPDPEMDKIVKQEKEPIAHTEESFLGKIGKMLSGLVDCCKE